MRRRVKFASQMFCLFILAASVQMSSADTSQISHTRLYFFTNPSCGPCHQLEPVILQLANEGFPVTIVNTTAQPEWASHFKVTRTPTTILVADQEVVGRKTGMVSGATLRSWFAHCAKPLPTTNSLSTTARQNPSLLAGTSQKSNASMKGTIKPVNPAELRALRATVRLKVTDPEGTSYATGTIIHHHQNECLVLTCGHVFRDSQGTGKVTAEYDFASGQPKTATGRILNYDAGDRDIALVTISTQDFEVEPVFVAQPNYLIQTSDQAFSIGCDHGENPTIRRTRIKNLAKYNGIDKYDIYGRPVEGRSGGGLFTPGGQLVGVCNAAAVDFDEGIYVALNTIYWQLAEVNLTNLFYGNNAIATNYETADDCAETPDQRLVSNAPQSLPPAARQWRGPEWTNTNRSQSSSESPTKSASGEPQEVIVIFRSNHPQGHPSASSQTIRIPNPSPRLINEILQASAAAPARLADQRRDMPAAPPLSSKNDQLRAQSPR